MQIDTTTSSCALDGCDKRRDGRSRLCSMHRRRKQRTGLLELAPKVARTCAVDGCESPHKARGWCTRHYDRWLHNGDVRADLPRYGKVSTPPAARFWRHVNKRGPIPADAPHLGPCWLWTGALQNRGYGYFAVSKGRMSLAHHFLGGTPPKGLEWDHLCFVRNCVRPEHLELVTHGENVRRQRTHGAAPKTECKWGHPFSEENTRVLPDGKRACRVCTREAMRRWRKRHSA